MVWESLKAGGRRESDAKSSGPPREDRWSSVYVLFTTLKGTKQALQSALMLTKDLTFRIDVLVPIVVPLPLPITDPPVQLTFRVAQALELIRATGSSPRVHVYLCRDVVQAVLKVVRPGSPVVVGIKKTWWPSSEGRLVKALQRTDHLTILARYD